MSNFQTNINTIVATLYQKGLRHAVISPGSRNAPLIMAFVRIGKIKCTSVADERSAAFIALGMAKQLQEPVAIICTSGSAVVNYYPAITEAFYMQVPLIVISADRPFEMLDRWDGQTIHQFGVFQTHVLGSFATPENSKEDLKELFSQLAEKVFDACNGKLKGPVHLNVPLKEPLYAAADSEFIYPEVIIEKSMALEEIEWELLLNESLFSSEIQKVLIIHGASAPHNNLNLNSIADTNFPVILSDCISNQHAAANIKNWENILLNTSDEQQKELIPDLLITTGKMILNKTIKNLFRKLPPGRHWHIDESGYCADTFFTNPVVMNLKQEIFFKKLEVFLSSSPSNYFNTWKNFSQKQLLVSDAILSENFNAFYAIQKVLQHLPENIVLHLANSMSVRYAAYLNSELKESWQIYSNRGASGIDGCTSTAMGASMTDHRIHVLFTGDIAFFYDINAFWQKQLPDNFKIILLNDFGGGIFKIIDGPNQLPERDPFLETPHHMNASHLAEHFNIDYYLCKTENDLLESLPEWFDTKQTALLEIQTDSDNNSKIFNQYKKQKI